MMDHAEKGTISNDHGQTLGIHIALFCKLHADALSHEIFQTLTAEEYPHEDYIFPAVAMILLDAEHRVIGNNAAGEELSSLQNRCVNSIARGEQEDLRDLNGEWYQNVFKQMPRHVLYEIMKRGFIPPPLP
jgi:hypothetical protein